MAAKYPHLQIYLEIFCNNSGGHLLRSFSWDMMAERFQYAAYFKYLRAGAFLDGRITEASSDQLNYWNKILN